MGENTARFLDAQRVLIREAALEATATPLPPGSEPIATASAPTVPAHTETAGVGPHREKRQATFEQVKQLQSQKHALKAIARHLGLSRNTVRRYFDLEAFVPKTHQRHSNLLEHEAYLRRRWQEGEQCAKSLLKEKKARGYNGSYYHPCRVAFHLSQGLRVEKLACCPEGDTGFQPQPEYYPLPAGG